MAEQEDKSLEEIIDPLLGQTLLGVSFDGEVLRFELDRSFFEIEGEDFMLYVESRKTND